MQKKSRQISLGYDTITGKRIRKRIYYTSEADFRRQEKEVIALYARKGIASSITYEQYLRKWWEAYISPLAVNTRRSYQTALNHTKSLYDKQMSKITRADLQNIINSISDRPTTCKKLCVLLNNIWENAVFDDVVGKNITKGIKRPICPKSERKALTREELEAISNTKFNEQEQLLVDILRQFGLRPGEALALSKSDFNRKEGTLTICKSLAHDGQKPFLKDTKTHSTRVLPVPLEFFELLPKNSRSIYLFTNKDGELLTRKQEHTLSQSIIQKVNRTMGGNKHIRATRMVLYSFRHTKATELYYTKGISHKAAAAYLGHSEEMFIRTYSHLDKDKEELEALRTMVI